MLKVCKYSFCNCQHVSELSADDDENPASSCTSKLQMRHQLRVTPGIFECEIASSPVRKSSGYSAKKSNNFSLHQVYFVIDSKWRTNFICTKSQITIRQKMHNAMARKMKGFKFLRKYCTNVTAGQFSMPRFLLCKSFDYMLERVDTGQSQLQ